MIRSPLALRLQPGLPVREQLNEAAAAGARGVVADATGELAPEQLSETGRRALRHALRSLNLELVALHLPTRRPFDTEDQLDLRLARAQRAFTLAYELGSRLVLARAGGLPPEAENVRREVFTRAVADLGQRADHCGVRLALEAGAEPADALAAFLNAQASAGLAASVDPSALLASRQDPPAAVRTLGPWIAHAYAPSSSGRPSAARGVVTSGMPPGAIDWEEYLGALEEVAYRGYLTLLPEPGEPAGAQFRGLVERLSRF